MVNTRRNRRQRGGECACSSIGGPWRGGGDPPGAMGPQRGTPFVASGGFRVGSRAKGGYRVGCRAKDGYRAKGGYRASAKNRATLRAFRQGKSIGFTQRASLKAKGLLPRTSRKNRGKYIVSNKYK